MFVVGDLIEIQLAPDSLGLRYRWSDISDPSTVYDTGYNGDIVIARVAKVGVATSPDLIPYMTVNYTHKDNQCVLNIPIGGIMYETLKDLPGFPKSPKDMYLAKCTCGGDKMKSTHYSWCDKDQDLRTRGFY